MLQYMCTSLDFGQMTYIGMPWAYSQKTKLRIRPAVLAIEGNERAQLQRTNINGPSGGNGEQYLPMCYADMWSWAVTIFHVTTAGGYKNWNAVPALRQMLKLTSGEIQLKQLWESSSDAEKQQWRRPADTTCDAFTWANKLLEKLMHGQPPPSVQIKGWKPPLERNPPSGRTRCLTMTQAEDFLKVECNAGPEPIPPPNKAQSIGPQAGSDHDEAKAKAGGNYDSLNPGSDHDEASDYDEAPQADAEYDDDYDHI